MFEDLCSWFAHPAARAAPTEMPPSDAVDMAVLSLVELWVARALAALCAAPDGLPVPVESALRAVSSDSMDTSAWLAVFDSLRGAGCIDDAPSTLPEPTEAAAALGCSPTLHDLAACAGAGDLPASYVPALAALLRHHRDLASMPLCWIRDTGIEGDAMQVRFRRLVGTAFAPLQTTRIPAQVGVPEDQLAFWDGAERLLVLPRWLAYWDAHTQQARWYHGRDPRGRTRYRGWRADDAVERAVPEDAPAFLTDDAFGTPAPARPTTFRPPTGPPPRHGATHPMLAERVSVPPASLEVPQIFEDKDPLVVRVLTTRYVLRFARIEPGQTVVVGRNADHATFVLHHQQISRAHTRIRHRDGVIWVADLGSTNGTQLNGQDVGADEIPAAPGDVIAVGPIVMRLERTPEAELQKLEQVTSLEPSPDRDPLTRLLLPRHLIEHLPSALQPSFRDGGTVPEDAPTLWGVVLRIDRLHAMHAQHGEQVADAAYAITARLVQGLAPAPAAVLRLSYGEMLVPLVGVDEATAREHATAFVRTLRAHPWEPPLRRVTLSAGVGQKLPEEAAAVWVGRIRKAVDVGRMGAGTATPPPAERTAPPPPTPRR